MVKSTLSKHPMPEVIIEKLVFGGQGLAHHKGKAVFVWNALPDERVEIDILENKKTHSEAVATKIITASPYRIKPVEDHFLSCSPWQILPFEKENEWKKIIALEAYQKIGNFSPPVPLEIITSEPTIGYRNKMEYSFEKSDDESIKFAFFERGGRLTFNGKRKRPINFCALADIRITKTSYTILQWINEQKIPIRSLKTLIIRSNRDGDIIAGLFLKDRLLFADYPKLENGLRGFHIYYSTHHSPASVPTEPLASFGESSLTEKINDSLLSYGLFSFFQIHIPIFTSALETIKSLLITDTPVLDFYSGVGAISIPLAPSISHATLLDSNTEAIEYAEKNIEKNNLRNYSAMAIPAEKMTSLITRDHTLIVDPPRAGLHDKVVNAIISNPPAKIVYLSCNLATHARDIAKLKDTYDISLLRLYNFFPRTPHIEGLCVLERK